MPTKEESAKELAEAHASSEPELKRVIRFLAASGEESTAEPIKLLEVNAATVTTGSVELFAFAPSKLVPYPVVIAEVTPDEYERIEQGKIALPKGWSLENMREIFRAA